MADYSLTAVFGLDATGLKTGLKQVRSEVNDLVSQWGKWAALAGAGAFIALAKDAVQLAGKLSDTAMNLGMNVTSLQALEAQHKRNGVSEEQLTKALEKTKAAVLASAAGNDTATASLRALGLSTDKLIKLPLDKQYEAIAKAAFKAKDQNAAYSAVCDLLGEKVGPKLMASLKDLGEIGLPGVTKAAMEAGQVMSNETIAALDRAGDAIDDFKKRATVAVGNILVNFRTAEGIELMGLQLLKAVSVFAARIVQVPYNVGQLFAAVLFGTFEAAGGYLLNAGISAVQAIGKAMNAILPSRFQIDIGNLDQFRSDSKGFVDDIARNISMTEPTAFIDAVAGGYDDLIAKQQKVVDQLNKTDLKPATDALTKAGEVVKVSVVKGADAVEDAGKKSGKEIEDAAKRAAATWEAAQLGARGGAQFNTAPDSALAEIVRRNSAQAHELRNQPGGVFSAAAYTNRLEAGRLEAEAANAKRELETRANLRSAFASGGEAGVFRAFPTTDPITLGRMIDQFARNLDVSEQTQLSIKTIENGLVNRGIIRRT